MFNPIDSYSEIGRMTGKARNERDESRAQFHTKHLHKMLSLESQDDKNTARKAFDEAYSAARNVPRVY